MPSAVILALEIGKSPMGVETLQQYLSLDRMPQGTQTHSVKSYLQLLSKGFELCFKSMPEELELLLTSWSLSRRSNLLIGASTEVDSL